MPQLANKPVSNATAIKRPANTAVYVKRWWSDDWQLAKKPARERPPRDSAPPLQEVAPIQGVLRATGFIHAAWPQMGTATFKYHFGGEVRLEDETAYRAIAAAHLTDWYVKIVRIVDDSKPTWTAAHAEAARQEIVEWVGVFTEQSFQIQRKPSTTGDRAEPSGDVEIIAYDLRALLARTYLTQAWWEISTPVDLDIGLLRRSADVIPPLNRVYGEDTLSTGNRSDEHGMTGTYLFGGTARWSVKQFIDYCLSNYGLGTPAAAEVQIASGLDPSFKATPLFRLGGHAAAHLENLEAAGSFEGRSIHDVIDSLVPRNKGFGIAVESDGAGEVVLNVYSVLDVLVTGEDARSLPANPNQVHLDLDADESLEDVLVRFSAEQRYDAVEVRGARITVTGTWSVGDGTVEAAWSSALAIEALTATGGAGDALSDAGKSTLAQADDRFRTADRYRAVFAELRVSDDWWEDGLVSDGRALESVGATLRPLVPLLDDEGRLEYINRRIPASGIVARRIADFYYVFRHLTRLDASRDYTIAGAPRVSPTGVEAAYLPLLAWIAVDDQVDAGDPQTYSYYPLERIPGPVTGSTSQADDGANTYPLRRDLGIRAEFPDRLILAAAEAVAFGAVSSEEYAEPTLRWQRVGFTGTIETEFRVKVRAEIGGLHQVSLGRTKLIHVPSARFDYCAPGTVVDVRGGALKHLESSNAVLRDDSALLRWIAALARSYYGRPRSAVTLRRKDVSRRPQVGALLSSVSGVAQSQQIDTVITQVAVNYEANEVTIQTSFNELDFE